MVGVVYNNNNKIRWHGDNLVLQCTKPSRAANLNRGTGIKIYYVGDVVLVYRRDIDDTAVAREVVPIAEDSGFIGTVDRTAEMMASNGRSTDCTMLPLSVLETRQYGKTACTQLDIGDVPYVYVSPGKMVIFTGHSQHVNKVVDERAVADEDLEVFCYP